MEVSQSEYQNWLNDPITREVRRILHERQEVLKTGWVEGKWADGEDSYARGLANGMLQMEVLDNEFE